MRKMLESDNYATNRNQNAIPHVKTGIVSLRRWRSAVGTLNFAHFTFIGATQLHPRGAWLG